MRNIFTKVSIFIILIFLVLVSVSLNSSYEPSTDGLRRCPATIAMLFRVLCLHLSNMCLCLQALMLDRLDIFLDDWNFY